MHGADWQAVYDKYRPLLPYVAHRADLGYLIAMVGGELVGRPLVSSRAAATCRATIRCRSGMLGADYAIENGRYRIQQDLHRRELESRAAGATERARRAGLRRRLPARGQRPAARAADQHLSAL